MNNIKFKPGSVFVLMPVLVLLINLFNHPIEQGINQHYINDAARILREMPNLTIIGVTGSYGKTSVKYFLSKLLATPTSLAPISQIKIS